jgi:ketosteroid isomerase-like protein
MQDEIAKIKEVIRQFQQGYLNRDLNAVEKFMDLFCDEGTLEVIGTNAHIKGQGEWCLDKHALHKLVYGDWKSWGDLRINTDDLNIHVNGQTAWFAATATVSRTLEPTQSYQKFMGYVKWVAENEPEIPAKDKLLDVLHGGIITLAEAEKGARYIWPIRLTAVLVKEKDQWRFCQMTFSFPTIYPPDVRLTESSL